MDFYLWEHLEDVYEVRMNKTGELVKPYFMLQGARTTEEFCDFPNCILKWVTLVYRGWRRPLWILVNTLWHCNLVPEATRTMSSTNLRVFYCNNCPYSFTFQSRNFVTVANRTHVDMTFLTKCEVSNLTPQSIQSHTTLCISFSPHIFLKFYLIWCILDTF
jgi:hypothetical protein